MPRARGVGSTCGCAAGGLLHNHLTPSARSRAGPRGYAGGMDSTRLTEQQQAELAAKVAGMSDDLARLLGRMREVDWPRTDDLYLKVKYADEAVRDLHGRLQGPAPEEYRRPWEPDGSGRS